MKTFSDLTLKEALNLQRDEYAKQNYYSIKRDSRTKSYYLLPTYYLTYSHGMDEVKPALKRKPTLYDLITGED